MSNDCILIRLCQHAVNNPHQIDKMIIIKGLPYEWIFKKTEHGDQLLKPWEPDADVNVPLNVRALTEPITFCQWFAPVRHYDKNYEGFWDTRTVWGLKIDYSFGPGQELWDKIEDFIDRSLPRGEKMPVPVITAKDQKSGFETFIAKKSARGGGMELTPSEVPIVDLRKPVLEVPQAVVSHSAVVCSPTLTMTSSVVPIPTITSSAAKAEFKETSKTAQFSCLSCGKRFDKPRALRMHITIKHRLKEKVKV